MQLTGPNSSIGLTLSSAHAALTARLSPYVFAFRGSKYKNSAGAARRPGGFGEGATPDPIPNSAVKPLSADGTSS